MANKKIEKALYGPSTVEVAIGAVLGLVLGVLVAGVYLVFKPVQPVKESPKEPVKGIVYYLPGKTDSNKARGWQDKVATFVKGGQVVANEDELNAWAASLGGGAPAAKADAKPAKPGEKPKADDKAAAPASGGNGDFLSASGLNFRIEGDRLHIAQKVVLNYYGIAKEVVMQTSGNFQRGGESFVFKPDEIYLGSCPVHALPGIGGALTKALIAKAKVPDDFRAAWAKITAMAVEGGLVKVTTQP
jgi:hypothetical protein